MPETDQTPALPDPIRSAADHAPEPQPPGTPTVNSTTPPAPQDHPKIRGLFAIDPSSELDVFEGWHHPDVDWNRGATPAFDRANAEKVIDWASREEIGDPPISFTWDHDTLVMREPDDGREHLVRIEPDADGRYPIGAFAWVWEEVMLPETETLGPWVRRVNEEAAVRSAAYNLMARRAAALGIGGNPAASAGERAGLRALHELAAIRPPDENAELPEATVQYLASHHRHHARDTPGHPLTWAALTHAERQDLRDLAVNRATPAQQDMA